MSPLSVIGVARLAGRTITLVAVALVAAVGPRAAPGTARTLEADERVTWGLGEDDFGPGTPREPRMRPRVPTSSLIEGVNLKTVLEDRFRAVLARGGVKVRQLRSGQYEVALRVRPPHDPPGHPRGWRRTELVRILQAIQVSVSSLMPISRLAASSRVEAEVPGQRATMTVSLDEVARAVERQSRTEAPTRHGHVRPDTGPPGAPGGSGQAQTTGQSTPPSAPSWGAENRRRGQGQTTGQSPPPSAPPGLQALGDPGGAHVAWGLAGPGGVGRLDPRLGGPAVPGPSPFPPGPLPPSLATGSAPGQADANAALTFGGLSYPRDAEAIEWAIERSVTTAVQSTLPVVGVRARFLRPRMVRVNVRAEVSAAQAENLPLLLTFLRDAVFTVMGDQFPGLKLFGRGRIEVVESQGKFVRSYRLNDLTPIVGDSTPHDPFFRVIRVERARVVDLPRAWPLPAREAAFALRYNDRHLAPGVYSNVSTSRSNAYALDLRGSMFERLELAASVLSYTQTVQPVRRGLFTNSEAGLFALTFGAKYLLPYQINGLNLALGIDHSFQPGDERQFYLADDFERMYDLYAVASGRLWDSSLIHLVAKQAFVTERPTFADATISTLGVAFEYAVMGKAVLGLELKYDVVSPTTIASFGTLQAGDGLVVNAVTVFGSRLGDVEFSVRKINVPEFKEIGLGFAYRFH